MHVGERPYVLSPSGPANLSERPLTVEAMSGVLTDLLSADDQRHARRTSARSSARSCCRTRRATGSCWSRPATATTSGSNCAASAAVVRPPQAPQRRRPNRRPLRDLAVPPPGPWRRREPRRSPCSRRAREWRPAIRNAPFRPQPRRRDRLAASRLRPVRTIRATRLRRRTGPVRETPPGVVLPLARSPIRTDEPRGERHAVAEVSRHRPPASHRLRARRVVALPDRRVAPVDPDRRRNPAARERAAARDGRSRGAHPGDRARRRAARRWPAAPAPSGSANCPTSGACAA